MTVAHKKRHGSLPDLRLVGGIQLAGMRVVIADRLHQVATIFNQIGPKNGTGCSDVVARFIDEPAPHPSGRFVRIGRKRLNPTRIDLHDPEVLRSVGVIADSAGSAAFDHLDRRKHPGRQVVDRCNECHAGEERNHNANVIDDRTQSFYLLPAAEGSGE
jgi:hypothetical protein